MILGGRPPIHIGIEEASRLIDEMFVKSGEVKLQTLSKSYLVKLARSRGVPIGRLNKADIIKAITGAH